MREIKFRQPIFENGKFSYFHYFGFIKQNSGWMFVGIASNNTIEEIQQESQQFTGLKDKNGKDIYEGDILKVKKFNLITNKETSSIVFFLDSHAEFQHKWNEGSMNNNTGEFWINEPLWEVACSLLGNVECEVIGNIYEQENV